MSCQIQLLVSGSEIPDYIRLLTEQLMTSTGRTVGIQSNTIQFINRPKPTFPRQWKPEIFSSSANPLPLFNTESTPELVIDLRPVAEPLLHTTKVIRCDFFTCSTEWAFPRLAACIVERKKVIEIHIGLSRNQENGGFLIETAKLPVRIHSYKKSLEQLIQEVNLLLVKSARLVLENANPNLSTEQLYTEDTPNYYTSSEVSRSQFTNLIKHRLNQVSTLPIWNCAKVDLPIQQLALSKENHSNRTHWMHEGDKRTFKADPFGIEQDGKSVLFFEYMQSGRGAIYNSQKNLPILDGSHFSYPYTLEFENKRYLLPENIESEQLILYQLNETLNHIEQQHILLNGFSAVDPSIVFYNNTWWLFCTDGKNKGADTRLHVFYSDTLTGSFTPHQHNPVKTDICSARPAGHLFKHQGSLYRPGQNSGETYGGVIVVHKIERLSAVEFFETPVNTLSPSQFGSRYPNGLHTISACGEHCYIDGKRYRRTLTAPFRRK